METIPFTCKIIPGEKTPKGRIYSEIHIKKMTDWLDKLIPTKMAMVMVIDSDAQQKE